MNIEALKNPSLWLFGVGLALVGFELGRRIERKNFIDKMKKTVDEHRAAAAPPAADTPA